MRSLVIAMIGVQGLVKRGDKTRRISNFRIDWGIDFTAQVAIVEGEIAPRWTCRKAPAGLFISGGCQCP